MYAGFSPPRNGMTFNASLATPKRGGASASLGSSPYPSSSPGRHLLSSSPLSWLAGRDHGGSPLSTSPPFKPPGEATPAHWASSPRVLLDWSQRRPESPHHLAMRLGPQPEAAAPPPESPTWLRPLPDSPHGLSQGGGPRDTGKRGRPRADHINHLIIKGSSSPSEIKCKVCSRVFPREKSLQAHLRTHTGERPYLCDFPGCAKRFTQSGQLKTHQRLHAGEKPFVCSAHGCGNRYTHANRQCPLHPLHKPQRSTELVLQPVFANGEDRSTILQWLSKYRQEREEKTPGKVPRLASPSLTDAENPWVSALDLQPGSPHDLNQPKKCKTKRGLDTELEQENRPQSENVSLPEPSILAARLGISPHRQTLGDITPTKSSSNVLKIKKRWLQGIFDEEKQRQEAASPLGPTLSSPSSTSSPHRASSKSFSEDLACPIQWNEDDEDAPLGTSISAPRSPKSWVVARALVDLKASRATMSGEQEDNQPLNLSVPKRSSLDP